MLDTQYDGSLNLGRYRVNSFQFLLYEYSFEFSSRRTLECRLVAATFAILRSARVGDPEDLAALICN